MSNLWLELVEPVQKVEQVGQLPGQKELALVVPDRSCQPAVLVEVVVVEEGVEEVLEPDNSETAPERAAPDNSNESSI